MEGLRQKQKVDSAKKHGQPLMLGEDIDKQLQLYLQKVSNQGGVITASVVVELVAAARGILEFNGHSRQWPHSVLVVHKETGGDKPAVDNFKDQVTTKINDIIYYTGG